MHDTSSDAATLRPGQIIGGCRIVREIKRGGMGCVYLAEDTRLGRRVAVKTILPFHDDQRARKLFLREAKTCAQIDHPNVIVIHQSGEERGTPFIVMPFVDGKNLSEFLKEQGEALPWQTVVRVLKLAVKGLAAVHAGGLVHRDIKPSNIMVSGGGRVYLMDFGLVRDASDNSQARSGGILGTPNYMSPEQSRGEEIDARSDIFSVGSTLYHLLTNEIPYGKGHLGIITAKIASNHPLPPVHQVNPAVPRPVSDLVRRAMAFDRGARYQSAADLNRGLRQLLTPQPQAFAPLSSMPEPEASHSVSVLKPQLAPLDLVPLDLTESHDAPPKSYVSRYILGAAGLVALLMLFLANISQEVATPPQPVVLTPPEGMVLIDTGPAYLGISRPRLVEHFRQIANAYDFEIPVYNEDNMDMTERIVTVPRFFMDVYEVTNGQYLQFVNARDYHFPATWNGVEPTKEQLKLPVTGVTVADAEAYAAWANKRLPTEAEWIRAFHGDKPTLFPWGDEWDESLANVLENKTFSTWAPVTATPGDVSEFGVCNLVGNVYEMTRDRVTIDGERWLVAKGANCFSSGSFCGVAAHFDHISLDSQSDRLGFRCVQDIPESPAAP